jgi:7-carboxy-7-deazaguanine synthase
MLRTVEDERMRRRLALLEGKPPGELVVHEVYRSMQGESTFAGLPCVFVRLAACDARCSWCDTPHAFYEGERMPLATVIERVVAFGCPLAELTGGEPLLQAEALDLMRELCDRGLTVLLETSGAHDVSAVDPRVHVILDIKCPDSGESARNRWQNLEALQPTAQIKLVVASRADFDWGAGVVRRHGLDRRHTVIFSPAFGLVAPRDLADWLLASGLQARMQLQLHKHVWSPDARGV